MDGIETIVLFLFSYVSSSSETEVLFGIEWVLNAAGLSGKSYGQNILVWPLFDDFGDSSQPGVGGISRSIHAGVANLFLPQGGWGYAWLVPELVVMSRDLTFCHVKWSGTCFHV